MRAVSLLCPSKCTRPPAGRAGGRVCAPLHGARMERRGAREGRPAFCGPFSPSHDALRRRPPSAGGERGRSERQTEIHTLLPLTGLVDVGDLAAAAISDAGLRDLGGVDGVIALDVLWPHDT